jgi:hypothetical protein
MAAAEMEILRKPAKYTLSDHKRNQDTRCFKYDRDDLCVNKPQFVPVIFEPPCILNELQTRPFCVKSTTVTINGYVVLVKWRDADRYETTIGRKMEHRTAIKETSGLLY